MKVARFSLIGALCALAACAASSTLLPEPALAPVAYVAATPEQGGAVLSAQDEYFDAVSPADISIRLSGAADATPAALGRLYASETLAWTPEERARLEAMVARRRGQLDALTRWLPANVLFIKGSVRIENGFPHTRANAIFWGTQLPPTDRQLDGLFFHELFHVLTRANQRRHDDFYAIVGFTRCPLAAPSELSLRMLTNPDAPIVNHASAVDDLLFVTPVLTANPPRFDPAKPQLGEYFAVEFMALRRGSDGRCHPTPSTLTQDQLREAMLNRAGRNTNYLFHPEEVLAVNFSQMMTGRPAQDRWVHERLAALLGVEPAPPEAQ